MLLCTSNPKDHQIKHASDFKLVDPVTPTKSTWLRTSRAPDKSPIHPPSPKISAAVRRIRTKDSRSRRRRTLGGKRRNPREMADNRSDYVCLRRADRSRTRYVCEPRILGETKVFRKRKVTAASCEMSAIVVRLVPLFVFVRKHGLSRM